MLRFDKKRALFLIATFLFLMEVVELFTFDAISKVSIVLGVATSALFIVYAASYLLYSGRPVRYATLERYLPYLFVSTIALFFAHIIFALLYLHASSSFMLWEPFYLLEIAPIFLLILLPILFGASIWREKVPKAHARGAKIFSYILLAAGVTIVLAVFISGYFAQHFYVSDEEFITINAAFAAASGQNPYATPFAAKLYNYTTAPNRAVAYTYTTNNTFEAGVDYPALSFLATMPVALLSKFLYHNVSYKVITQAELGVFISMFLIALAFVLEKKKIRRPDVTIIVFTALFFVSFSSHLDFLILTLAVVAFYMIDSKYLWIVLGLAAALQELLWIAVLLFLVYTFRNHGVKRGALNLFGIVAIFLIINGYFITSSPSQYIGEVFAPASGYIIPSAGAPFGYAVVTLYNVLLSSSDVLFYAAIASSIIAFAYLNEKRLIFLFSLIPLMFLFRGIYPYYIFFLPLSVLCLYIPGAKHRNAKEAARPLYRNIAVALIVLIAVVSVLLLVRSHDMFTSATASVTNQRLVTGQVANYTLYNATLHYPSGSPDQLSVVEYVMYYNAASPAFYGLSQGNLLVEPAPRPVNSSTGYLVNPNRIYLGSSNGSLNISLLIPTVLVEVNGSSGPVNTTAEIAETTRIGNASVYMAQCILYNNAYYYTCPAAYST